MNSLSYGEGLIKKMREIQAKNRQGLIDIATKFVGVTEESDNSGMWVKIFQKAVDGVAQKEPWCAGFAHYCLNENDKAMKIKHNVFKSESCLNIWRNVPRIYKSLEPQIGYLVVWQMSETAGHIGIVTGVSATKINTIEGNTGDGVKDGVVREGDGVYARERLRTPKSAKFKLLGYINPYAR
jgi:hypothetical protein